jgi:hypothetical protein
MGRFHQKLEGINPIGLEGNIKVQKSEKNKFVKQNLIVHT